MSNETRTSCIVAPPEMRRVVIKQEYVGICEDRGMQYPKCAAALLNMFEHWTNYKITKIEEEKRVIRAAAAKGKSLKPKATLWIFMAQVDIKTDELFNLFGETQISKSITELKAAGFIKCRENPDKSKRYDRTRQYLFEIKTVQSAVDEWHKNLEANPYQHGMEAVPIRDAILTGTETIPQITTQIPNTEEKETNASSAIAPGVVSNPVEEKITAIEDIKPKGKDKGKQKTPEDAAKAEKKKAVDALIEAYLEVSKAIVVNPYGNKTNRALCEEMHRQRITPQVLKLYYAHKKTETFWKSKPVPINVIAQGIIEWRDAQKPVVIVDPLTPPAEPRPDVLPPDADLADPAEIDAMLNDIDSLMERKWTA